MGEGATPPDGGLAADRAGSGARVVLVHGFTQSARSWRVVAGELEAAHEVVTVDLPGHGGSAHCAARDLDQAARLLGEAGGRATYVGYSMGGRVCLLLALAEPELVEGLVLVGATPGIVDGAERAARRASDEALAGRIEALGLEGFLDEWLAGPLFAHLTPAQADREARLVNTAAGLAAALRALGTGRQEPCWERLGELAMPVLAVAGEDDAKFAALAERMARAIGPNARAALLAGAGHAVAFERPGAFVGELRRFLAGR
ncbi:MAG TPA: alpha/beta fold hydrolase [Acidimicrobiales bacterium]|nr:alpha/beta fold hydrolase [Acidimicrobiales bacterium]